MAISLKDAYNCYMGDASQARASSFKRSILLRLVNRFPDREFRDISARDVAHFLYGAKGVALNKSPSTISSYRSCLKGFFAYGLKMNWIGAPIIIVRPIRAPENLFAIRMGLPCPPQESDQR